MPGIVSPPRVPGHPQKGGNPGGTGQVTNLNTYSQLYGLLKNLANVGRKPGTFGGIVTTSVGKGR